MKGRIGNRHIVSPLLLRGSIKDTSALSTTAPIVSRQECCYPDNYSAWKARLSDNPSKKMCIEHYHEVYCANCLQRVGAVFTGKRLYCDNLRKRGRCTVEECQLCKHARSKVLSWNIEAYPHECMSSCCCESLRWLWRDFIMKIQRKLCSVNCEM